MITKFQLLELIDANKRFTWTHTVPWSETSLSRLYDAVEQQIEGGAIIDIRKARPVGYDFTKEVVEVEMELDCSDIFEEEAEHLGDGE